MADESQKLSQQEIDALLEMLPQESEEAEAQPPTTQQEQPDVQAYDFRGSVKLPKEQTWTLQMIHEDLAKRLTAFLSVYLRSKVQVTLSALEQGTYAVFISDMPTPTITYIVSLSALPGRIILGIQADLAIAIIDRMLGGTGLSQAQSRELTSLETGLLRKAVEKILDELAGAWENITEIEPIIEGVVMNPLFAGVAFPSDSALLTAYDVFFEDSSGTMNITIPFSVLDPIAQELSSGMWGRRTASRSGVGSDELMRQMAAHLAQIKVPLSVRMTTPGLHLEEMSDLEAGDILLLDARADAMARIYIGGQHKGWGRPGRIGRRLAVQIEKVIESEPEDLIAPASFQEDGLAERTEPEPPPESADPDDLSEEMTVPEEPGDASD